MPNASFLPFNPREQYTRRQAAALAKKSPRTIARAEAAGRLVGRRFGTSNNCHVTYGGDELNRLLGYDNITEIK